MSGDPSLLPCLSRLVRRLRATLLGTVALIGVGLLGQTAIFTLWISTYPPGQTSRADLDLGQPFTLHTSTYKLDPESLTTVRWTRDGVPLAATSSSLVFPAITAAYAGVYEVTFSQGGTVRQAGRAELRVLPPRLPVINDQLPPIDCFAGDTAVVSIGVYGGTYPYSYTWFRDGVEIARTDVQRISIPNFSAALAGNYTVTVTNSVGSVTSRPIAVRLVAPILPVLSPHFPADAAVAEGTDVVLSVDVTASSPPLSFQWFKDGVAVGAPTAGSNFTLTRATRADAGNYHAVVTNAAGSATSRTARLSVGSDVPLQLVEGPKSLTVLPDEDALFWINVIGGPPITYQWFHDGRAIINADGPSYRVSAAGVQNAGRYRVVVRNEVSHVIGDATLTVNAIAVPELPLGLVYFEESTSTWGVKGAEGLVLQSDRRARGIYSLSTDAGNIARPPLDGAWFYHKVDARTAELHFDAPNGDRLFSRTLMFETESRGTFGPGSGVTGTFVLKNPADTAPLVNTSNRSFVRPGGTSIAGFILSEPTNRVLVRAVGPGLAAFGAEPTLTKPVLRLHAGQTVVAENHGWTTSAGAESLRRSAEYTGAFPLAEDSTDSAVIAVLPPGAYTASASSAVATDSGEVLIEVYLLR